MQTHANKTGHGTNLLDKKHEGSFPTFNRLVRLKLSQYSIGGDGLRACAKNVMASTRKIRLFSHMP
jgi:hypothetical protein